jgi:hypothetical protein
VFSRYLAGVEPTPYLVEAYTRGHRHLPALTAPPDAVDELLLGGARLGALSTWLADAYARRARPTGILRQKLTLMLAVLESSPPAHRWVNGAATGPVLLVLARVAWAVIMGALALVVGAVLYGPLHLVASFQRSGRGA